MKKMILAFAALCLILGGCGAKDAYTGTASDGTGDGTEEIICFSAAEAVEEPSGTEDEEEAFLFVYICGAVRKPGVYQVRPGARVYEAVEMAGGLLPEADGRAVNLAAYLSDGQMIAVPAEGEEAADGDDGDERVNINTAGIPELMTLPGIGKAKAEAIAEYRDKNGPFHSPEDIMRVPGIKEAVFEKIKAYIRTE
ncbi:MAG: helix-hairpin-helix domain-containing protein [Lachnospiraceae bacterium]|nr:helix-hairpin-helix domain-containing protein [Lachnospiraceae bacterium]